MAASGHYERVHRGRVHGDRDLINRRLLSVKKLLASVGRVTTCLPQVLLLCHGELRFLVRAPKRL